jgi:hypothetical protein
MNTPDQLIALEELKELKARYCRHADNLAAEEFAGLFTEDAVMDMREALPGMLQGPEGIIRGRTAIRDLVTGVQAAGVRSVHQVMMPELKLLSSDEASGIWALEDILCPFAAKPEFNFHGWGHYHETYKRVGGSWRFATVKVTRLLTNLWKENAS